MKNKHTLLLFYLNIIFFLDPNIAIPQTISDNQISSANEKFQVGNNYNKNYKRIKKSQNLYCKNQYSLVANSYDWGRKLIDRPKFPSGPYDARPGDSIIVLKNYGSLAVAIRGIVYKTDTLGRAFEFNETAFTNIIIPDSSELYVPVKFHPTKPGHHVLEFIYDNSANSDTKTKLEGTGVVPRIYTTDVDFGTTEIGDTTHPNTKLVRFSNMSNADWAYGDTIVTINDFTVQPNGNEISTNTANFGTEGFRYDKSKLSLPITLKQGEFVEFPAEFVSPTKGNHTASLQSVSNAETEVPSNWFGFGNLLGIQLTAGTVTTSNGSSCDLIASIANVGTAKVMIDSIKLEAENPESNGLFNFKTGADSLGFLLPLGVQKDVVLTYNARRDSLTFPPRTYTTHKAWLLAYYNKKWVLANDSCEITGTTIYPYMPTYLQLPDRPVNSKNKFIASLHFGNGNIKEVINSYFIPQIDVKIKFNSSFLTTGLSDINVGSLLQDKFQLQNVSISDTVGEINLELVNSHFQNINDYNDGEILNITFGTNLNENCDSITIPIEASVNCPGSDLDVYDCAGYITIWNTQYLLKPVYPNPVIKNKATVSFRINKDAQTKILIYNEIGQLVLSPFNEYLKEGIYSFDIDVTTLNNGVYWYEILSGDFNQKQMLVISR